jgi:DNA primase catalytic core
MSSTWRRRLAVGVAAEVKSKLSVVDVVGETVALKKAGTTYKGLCPFHGEKTPSFVVTPQRETWHCFGCGLGGDIFSFVMQRDTVTFPEALRTLAQRAGVEIDERTQREDAHKARLRTVLDSAIAFYHAVLTASKAGAPALEYLHGRDPTSSSRSVWPRRDRAAAAASTTSSVPASPSRSAIRTAMPSASAGGCSKATDRST